MASFEKGGLEKGKTRPTLDEKGPHLQVEGSLGLQKRKGGGPSKKGKGIVGQRKIPEQRSGKGGHHPDCRNETENNSGGQWYTFGGTLGELRNKRGSVGEEEASKFEHVEKKRTKKGK